MGDMIDRDAVIARLLAYGTASTEKAADAIAAIPAVTVGMAALPRYVCTDLGPRLDPIGAFIHVDDLAALEPVTQPAPTCLHMTADMARDCPICTPSPLHTPAPIAQLDAGDVREAAQSLIDRLNEYENEAWMRGEESREWCGKVQPAKARLAALLTEKPDDRA